MEARRTKNGDRALLVYLLDAQGVDESALESAIETVLEENEVGEVEKGATIRDELTDAQRVEIILAEEGLQRSIRVGAVEGTLLASLYFAQQPPIVEVVGEEEEEEEEGEEPEPLNLPGVVCATLAERFPGLTVGASAFVLKPDQRVFDFVVFEHDRTI